jgi:hypothetical protein
MTQTQSQDELIYASSLGGITATSMNVKCTMTKVTTFLFLRTSYLLVHQSISNQLIVGTHFTSSTPCFGVNPIPVNSNCIYTVALYVPPSHTKHFISLKAFKMSRANDINLSVYVDFKVKRIDSNDISIELYYAHGGEISFF